RADRGRVFEQMIDVRPETVVRPHSALRSIGHDSDIDAFLEERPAVLEHENEVFEIKPLPNRRRPASISYRLTGEFQNSIRSIDTAKSEGVCDRIRAAKPVH